MSPCIEVFCHERGEWTKKITSGDAPPNKNGTPAEVVEDAMYIMTSKEGQMTMYALDFDHWRWTKLIPYGTPPLKGTNFHSTWQYGGKIYYFGGQTGYKDGPTRGQREPRYPEYVHVGWCTNQGCISVDIFRMTLTNAIILALTHNQKTRPLTQS